MKSCIYDIPDEVVLKQLGWEPKADSTLMSYKKEDLIEEIRCLEHNWAGEIKAVLVYQQRLENALAYFQDIGKKEEFMEAIKTNYEKNLED